MPLFSRSSLYKKRRILQILPPLIGLMHRSIYLSVPEDPFSTLSPFLLLLLLLLLLLSPAKSGPLFTGFLRQSWSGGEEHSFPKSCYGFCPPLRFILSSSSGEIWSSILGERRHFWQAANRTISQTKVLPVCLAKVFPSRGEKGFGWRETPFPEGGGARKASRVYRMLEAPFSSREAMLAIKSRVFPLPTGAVSSGDLSSRQKVKS